MRDDVSGYYCVECHSGPQDSYAQSGACSLCGHDLRYINMGSMCDDMERARDEYLDDMSRDQGCLG